MDKKLELRIKQLLPQVRALIEANREEITKFKNRNPEPPINKRQEREEWYQQLEAIIEKVTENSLFIELSELQKLCIHDWSDWQDSSDEALLSKHKKRICKECDYEELEFINSKEKFQELQREIFQMLNIPAHVFDKLNG